MKKFEAVDYFNIIDLLNEEEKLVQVSVRTFVDAEVIPIIEEYYQEAKFPFQLIPKLAELGVFGMTLPEKYGCAGMNNLAYGLVNQELERGDSGLRSFMSVQSSLVMYPIFTFGSEEQKMKWLPKLANAEAIGCFGLTEPDYGSNPNGMIAKAEKVSGGFLLNGAKMWITNGSIADIAIVWAKLDGVVKGFIVEKGFKGFSAPEIKKKHSLRASITSELIFEDVFVPDGNLLPAANGLKAPLMCLNQARFSIAWGVTGSMLACYDSALEYAKTRIQFNKPIASYQLTQDKLVTMLTEITKTQLLNLQLAKLKDSGNIKHTQISLAKRNNVEKALEIARTAREIFGASGITSEYPIMRHANNLESVKTYEGTHEMHTLIIGEDITGLGAF
ncbi:MAG: acyl-CoA dehydrogenase [Ignavibacteriales bacterium CG18_big_fil_WC_8_21_14_2_50_31_20]|nr:MAG: acyl-CoA dehydrogenase [Ignavibacteriales bacterium CG18_big_fil_WC_8_21_14_2_50_31_20]